MKASTIVKLNFLILGLGLTLFLIYRLNSKGLSQPVQQVLGLSAAGTAANPQGMNWRWCDTRVSSMVNSSFKLTQEGNQWVRDGGTKQAVDFLSVEKWFAGNCTVLVNPAKAVVDDAFVTVLMVKFINGKVDNVRRRSDGIYFWNGQTFTSPAFDRAIAELADLPVK